MPNRREFLKWSGCSVAALGTVSLSTIEAVARGLVTPAAAGLHLEAAPASGKPFRMTEPWYRQTIGRLQQKLGERGLRGMILSETHNVNYLIGHFGGGWERPEWLFVPTQGEVTMFGPGIDRETYGLWWVKDFQWYFDYPHAGPFNQIVLDKGPTVDLTEWMLQGVAKRGFGEGKIGVEREMTPRTHKHWSAILPKVEFVEAGDIPLKMRIVKTPEEIALTQVAIDYHDQALQFAHDLIVKRGPGIGDWQVSHQTEEYLEDTVFKEIKVDGRPNNGVGIRLGLSCRSGNATAYPHPNMHYHRVIGKGDAVQIAGGQHIGGYGGEGYRAMHLEPIPDLARKMWDCTTEMSIVQREESKPGRECRDVADACYKLASKAGLTQYLYHRPAHGIGMEGHQPPYISVGDTTVLQEGMMFSNETALYNHAGGYGYNHSNTLLITKAGAVQMNKVPMTKEFCLIKTGPSAGRSQ
jgi:Xaa-Pro dipeptidase